MALSQQNDWLVGDSEDESISVEDSFKDVNNAGRASPASNISNFPTAERLLYQNDMIDSISPISLFASDRSTKAKSSINVSSSVPATGAMSSAASKPKPPRPRPAYKGKAAKDDVPEQGASVSSVPTPHEVARYSSQAELNSEPAYLPSTADRANARPPPRQRHATTDGVPHAERVRDKDGLFLVPPSKNERSTFVIELSSDDHLFHDRTRTGARPSSSRIEDETIDRSITDGRSSSSCRARSVASISALHSSDPPTSSISRDIIDRDSEHNGLKHAEPTPPSSPFQTKRRRRRVLDDDYEDDLFRNPSSDKGVAVTGGLQTDSKEKSRKSHEKKVKAGKLSPSLSTVPSDEQPARKKRRTKDSRKKKSEEALNSSENVVDDSSEEDDLLLKPSEEDDRSRSDPASAIYPMNPPREASAADVSAPATALNSDVCVSSTHSQGKGKRVDRKRGKQRNSTKNKGDDLQIAARGAADEASEDFGVGRTSTTASTAGDGMRTKRNLRGIHWSDTEDELSALNRPKSMPQVDNAVQTIAPLNEERLNGRIESSDGEHGPDKEEDKRPRTKEVYDANKENQSAAIGGAQSPSISGKGRIDLPPQRASTMPRLPPRKDSMSAIIRRASSKVDSPLASPSPRVSAYGSPLAKSSRVMLSRIAPLHPNRRTPPPAPPRPPPPKKSKKMIALEEKWEEELAETIEGWACMGDEERAALRRAKRDAELGYDN